MWTALAIFFATTGILSVFAFTRSASEGGTVFSLILAAFVAGAVAGALIVSPGSEATEAGQNRSNLSGWSARLGIIGTWLTGAAFALLLANGSEVAGWFGDLTRSVAQSTTPAPRGDVLVQYGLGALMIAGAAAGLIFGALQMGTNGRQILANAARAARDAEEAASIAAAAAEQAKGAAKDATDSATEVAAAARRSVGDSLSGR